MHERQIGMAILAYADDNNGTLPNCIKLSEIPETQGNNDPANLHMKLQPYTKSRALFMCPADLRKLPGHTAPGTRTPLTIFEAFGSSYQVYGKADTLQVRDYYPRVDRIKSDIGGLSWPVHVSEVRWPSRTRIVRDAVPYHRRPTTTSDVWVWNVIYLDGHVRSLVSMTYNGIKAGDSPTYMADHGWTGDTAGIL